MTTTQEKIKALREEHKRKVESLLLEEQLIGILPRGNWSIYIGNTPLYGCRLNATLKHNFYSYGSGDKQPTIYTVRELAEQLPPVPMKKITGSFTSFVPTSYVDGMSEGQYNILCSRGDHDISGFTIKFSAFQHHTATFAWYTDTELGLTRISVVLPLQGLGIGYFNLRAKRHGKRGPVKYYEVCGLVTPGEHYTIHRGGAPVADRLGAIKRSNGGREYPNDFTLYYQNSTEYLVTAADFVNHVLRGRP